MNIIIHSLSNLAQGDNLWATMTHTHPLPLGAKEGVMFTNTPPLVGYHYRSQELTLVREVLLVFFCLLLAYLHDTNVLVFQETELYKENLYVDIRVFSVLTSYTQIPALYDLSCTQSEREWSSI